MSETVESILSQELAELQADIIRRHEQAGQIASGRTRAAFESIVTGNTGKLLGAGYAGVLERGRRGGKVPYNFGEILQRWAAAKGISFKSKADANRWAYFVTKKIRAEGTALYRSGQTIDIFDTAVREFQERLASRVDNYLSSEINNQIFTAQWK